MNTRHGWIMADLEDKTHLESLGVVVGEYNYKLKSFWNCKVSEENMERLDPYWGRYYWFLELST